MKKIKKMWYRGKHAFYRTICDLAYKNAVEHSDDVDYHVFLKWLQTYTYALGKLKKIPLA
jgi:hypothetical protein